MANPTTNYGWVMPAATDLVTDLPADFNVFGQAVDTSMQYLLGGTTGQVLAKTSGTNMAFTWTTPQVGDITSVGVTSPVNGGGTSGAVTIGIDDATTSAKGATQLTDSISSTSTTTAATPNSVKTSYDLANGAIAKTTVTTAGDIIYRNATVPTRLGIGTASQVLSVNSGATAPEWTTLAAAGLTLITRQTYTTSSAINIDNVFSATYENYFIICKNSAVSAASNINVRLRVSGADNSTSNYSTGAAESNSAGVTNRYNTAQSSFFAATFDQSSIWSMTATMVNPFLANTTSFHFSNLADSGGFRTGTGAGNFAATTSFTGFSLLPQAAATMTGVVAVYGYKI